LQMEKIAAALGMDPVTLRTRNMFRKGAVLATGQTLRESIGAPAVMKTCLARSDYRRKVKEYARWNRDASQSTWKGIGVALVHHGAGRGHAREPCGGGVDARWPCEGARGLDGNWSGHHDDAGAGNGGCAGRACRVDRGGDAGHLEGAEQRADGRQSHRDGGRRLAAACGDAASAALDKDSLHARGVREARGACLWRRGGVALRGAISGA